MSGRNKPGGSRNPLTRAWSEGATAPVGLALAVSWDPRTGVLAGKAATGYRTSPAERGLDAVRIAMILRAGCNYGLGPRHFLLLPSYLRTPSFDLQEAVVSSHDPPSRWSRLSHPSGLMQLPRQGTRRAFARPTRHRRDSTKLCDRAPRPPCNPVPSPGVPLRSTQRLVGCGRARATVRSHPWRQRKGRQDVPEERRGGD